MLNASARRLVRPALALGLFLVSVLGGADPASADVLVANSTPGSSDVTVTFSGSVSGVDATLFQVVPERYYWVGSPFGDPTNWLTYRSGVRLGCHQTEGVYDDVGAGTHGVSFVGAPTYNATTDTTDLVVRLESALPDPPDKNGMVVRVYSGAVSPDTTGCVPIAVQ